MTERDSLIAARSMSVYEMQELVVDACKEGLDALSEAEMVALAEHVEALNPDGWLGKLLREYLNAWREVGDRP